VLGSGSLVGTANTFPAAPSAKRGGRERGEGLKAMKDPWLDNSIK